MLLSFFQETKVFYIGGWANPVVEPETLDDITPYV
jgi:hypothetical protein